MNLLGESFLIMRDFYSHSPLWGCATNDYNGKIIAKFIGDNNYVVLNDSIATRVKFWT